MDMIARRIQGADWEQIAVSLTERGYAILPSLLSVRQSQALINQYSNQTIYRKTVVMERYRFGKGEYKYYDYPLPDMVQLVREQLYPHLVPVANSWMQALDISKRFPEQLQQLQTQCKTHNQCQATPLILKYGQGGYNTLHQDLYGDVYFPMQAAVVLSQPNVDYSGGEFVLTQQIPRAQSRAIVLNPNQGDMLIFTTNFKPTKGVRGYYRVNVKHGVSEVHHGERYTLGIIFHDAAS